MTTKSKASEGDTPIADELAASYATTEDMAAVLDQLAELSGRVDDIESRRGAEDMARAAAAPADPVFRAAAGLSPRRKSEGERQDEIVSENARRHLMEPAGDGVPSGAITPGVPTSAEESGEGAPEDPASPNAITTEDVAALNPPR